jgi:hypothetical protein
MTMSPLTPGLLLVACLTQDVVCAHCWVPISLLACTPQQPLLLLFTDVVLQAVLHAEPAVPQRMQSHVLLLDVKSNSKLLSEQVTCNSYSGSVACGLRLSIQPAAESSADCRDWPVAVNSSSQHTCASLQLASQQKWLNLEQRRNPALHL